MVFMSSYIAQSLSEGYSLRSYDSVYIYRACSTFCDIMGFI